MVDGGGGDPDEDESHDVEVEGAPMVFQDHVGISGEEDDHVEFLGAVGEAHDGFAGDDFEEEHEDGDEVEKISNELEHVHYYYKRKWNRVEFK